MLVQSGKLGGASRTDQPLPGYRFNGHVAACNINVHVVNELRLRDVGPQDLRGTGAAAWAG